VRIDIVPSEKAPEAKGWFLHLGSTMCEAVLKTSAPIACVNSNRIDLQFEGFDMTTNTVVIDPAPVSADAGLKMNAPETSPGCMSF
jgi:hypothetical protein